MKPFIQLLRLDKPIGILLLLWPTLWALWIASNGLPDVKNAFIFVMGVILMRSAGCVVNDLADKRLDLHVHRTHNRPLTTGVITSQQAMILFLVLCLMAFFLVLMTNTLTLILAVGALAVAIIYPFMKRYTHWPQLVLGIAFSFSIPMVFSAVTQHVPLMALILMSATICWTIAYDTQYAMVDRDDDVKIGIKSTAILFGRYDQVIIGVFQMMVIGLLCLAGWMDSFAIGYFVCVFLGFILMGYHQFLLSTRKSENYFRAFLNNQWFGAIVFLGVLVK